jgi:hypothetical protein
MLQSAKVFHYFRDSMCTVLIRCGQEIEVSILAAAECMDNDPSREECYSLPSDIMRRKRENENGKGSIRGVSRNAKVSEKKLEMIISRNQLDDQSL